MSAPLSEQQLDAIRTFIGDAKPASDALLLSFGKSVADRREHDHASQREDWYCLNLAAYMGERAAPVLRRLLDAEEQSEQRRQQAAASAASEDILQAQINAQAKEIDRLRARVAELEAAEHTDWRAWHDSDASMPLGQYTGRDAAMDHVHHVLAREENVSAEAIGLRVIWRADDPHGPEDAETAWECWLFDACGDDEQPTGYVVTPITVAAAYDPDGDE